MIGRGSSHHSFCDILPPPGFCSSVKKREANLLLNIHIVYDGLWCQCCFNVVPKSITMTSLCSILLALWAMRHKIRRKKNVDLDIHLLDKSNCFWPVRYANIDLNTFNYLLKLNYNKSLGNTDQFRSQNERNSFSDSHRNWACEYLVYITNRCWPKESRPSILIGILE